MDQYPSWADTRRGQRAPEVLFKGAPLPGPLYEVARIHFRTGSSLLDGRDKERLDYLADRFAILLREAVEPLLFVCIGSADVRGDPMRNRTLSDQRAREVCGHLSTALEQRVGAPAARTIAFKAEGHGPAESEADALLSRDAALARWRRVSVYSNTSEGAVAAAIERLRRQLRKPAGRAVAGHEKLLRNLRELVSTYGGRLARGPNTLTDHNTMYLVWYEARLEETERRYRALLEALDGGEEAFLAWMRAERRPYCTFARDVIARLEQERLRLASQLSGEKDPAKRELLREIIDGLRGHIASLEEELEALEEE